MNVLPRAQNIVFTHGRMSDGPDRGVENTKQKVTSFDYIDVKGPEFWEEETFGVLKNFTFWTRDTKCVFYAMGPTMPAHYVLAHVEMPANPRFVKSADNPTSSWSTYREVAEQIERSWTSWMYRHQLQLYKLLAIGPIFKTSEQPRFEINVDEWTNVIYLIFAVPENGTSTLEPSFSNKLPGYVNLTTSEHNARPVHVLLHFPHRVGCHWCKSEANHLGNHHLCSVRNDYTHVKKVNQHLGSVRNDCTHAKKDRPNKKSRPFSKKCGFMDPRDLKIDEVAAAANLAIALAASPRPINLEDSPSYRRWKARQDLLKSRSQSSM